MSESGFQRPGSESNPPPEDWPYHVPTPLEPAPSVALDEAPEVAQSGSAARPRRRVRLFGAALMGVLAGIMLGAVWVSGVVSQPAAPKPVPILVDTFPTELLGKQRNDVALREAGFGPTVARLDADFEEQLTAFRFAYGGDGATLGYGRLLALTIVNGTLPPTLPRDGKIEWNGRASETRRLILLKSSQVSCTFEPLPVFNEITGLDELGDLSSDGRTDCVLVDEGHDLSLRLAHAQVARGLDALSTASSFRDELETLHQELLSTIESGQ